MNYVTVVPWYEGFRAMWVCPRTQQTMYGLGTWNYDDACDEAREWAQSENIKYVPMRQESK